MTLEGKGTPAPATGEGGEGAKPAPAASGSGTTPPEPPAGSSAPPATGGEPLGDGGKAALDAERLARRDAEKQLRDAGFVRQGDKWVNTAQMSEIEKRDARIKELETENAGATVREAERNLRVAAIEAATTLKFKNPGLAWRLLEPSEVKYEDNGTTPKNVEQLLKKIAEAEPYLVNASGSDFGGGSRGKTPGQTPSMDELLRAAARGG